MAKKQNARSDWMHAQVIALAAGKTFDWLEKGNRADFQQWHGLGMNKDSRVTHVYWPQEKLKCHLPTNLVNMAQITYLNLANNNFRGRIDPIFKLINLECVQGRAIDRRGLHHRGARSRATDASPPARAGAGGGGERASAPRKGARSAAFLLLRERSGRARQGRALAAQLPSLARAERPRVPRIDAYSTASFSCASGAGERAKDRRYSTASFSCALFARSLARAPRILASFSCARFARSLARRQPLLLLRSTLWRPSSFACPLI
jgi:hypothetical protein